MPLLFLIFINNLPQSVSGKFTLFADDTTITLQGKDLDAVNARAEETMRGTEEWFTANELLLNSSKTQHMILTLRRMEGQQLPVKFLGVFLDPELRWDVHTVNLAKKLRSGVFLLRNLSRNVSRVALLTAYYAVCHSHLSYATILWGRSSGCSRIFALQRRAVRVVYGLEYREDYRRAFIDLGVLTLPSIYILQCLLYVRENLHLFDESADFHAYNTRYRSDLRAPYYRLERCQRGPFYNAVKAYNKLSSDIKYLNLLTFKKRTKKFLIIHVFYTFDEFLNCDVTNT